MGNSLTLADIGQSGVGVVGLDHRQPILKIPLSSHFAADIHDRISSTISIGPSKEIRGDNLGQFLYLGSKARSIQQQSCNQPRAYLNQHRIPRVFDLKKHRASRNHGNGTGQVVPSSKTPGDALDIKSSLGTSSIDSIFARVSRSIFRTSRNWVAARPRKVAAA